MKSNFLFTVFAFMILSFGGALYIMFMIPPAGYFVYLLSFLLFAFTALLFSIILYKFSSPFGHESDRQRYRRKLKASFVIGILVILLLLLQRHFDII